jgi:hypothetical protein
VRHKQSVCVKQAVEHVCDVDSGMPALAHLAAAAAAAAAAEMAAGHQRGVDARQAVEHVLLECAA